MNKKTKRILAVVVAVLFSITIIGGVVLACLGLRDKPVTASADTNSSWGDYPNSFVQLCGTYQFNENLNIDISRWGGHRLIEFNFLFTAPYGSNVTGLCSYIYLSINSNYIDIYYNSVTADFDDTFEVSAYVSEDGGWQDYYYRIITIDGVVPKDFENFLNEYATKLYGDGVYQDGYDSGYTDGESIGYQSGYTAGDSAGYIRGHTVGYAEGVNKGHSDSITNPISTFLEPVHQFMNTPFFGTLTYASIFNIVLFVLIALIFIKMFAGG